MFSRIRLVVVILASVIVFSATTAWAQISDIDGDGDIDNADLATIAGNFGLLGGFSDGDVNGDAVIDEADYALASSEYAPSGFGDYFGPLTVDLNPAQLIYNPVTGRVLLDQANSPGGVISTFILSSTGGFSAPGTANFPFGGALLHDAPSVIAQSDPTLVPAAGFPSNPHDLGIILPTGLDEAGLLAALSSAAVYVGSPGTGVRAFALVVLPEPASLTLCLVSLISVSWRRRYVTSLSERT